MPVRSINLTTEQLQYLQSKGNVSAYLRQLVERDMAGGRVIQCDDLETMVRRILHENGSTGAGHVAARSVSEDADDIERRATAEINALLGVPGNA